MLKALNIQVLKITTTPISKIAMFTDIHWGARMNNVEHNQDNLDFLDWFIANLEPDVTHIGFLGDWFEQRSAINVHSLAMSCTGLRKLNDLNLPIFFCVGNHDLYRRHTREIHSLDVFSEFTNIILINKVTSVNDRFLFSPFLFPDEYAQYLNEINDHEVVFGHFEFKNFVITGYNTVMERGPDHKLFDKPKRIFSGHFHKRQTMDNVHYIGNVFPTNFGDAGDQARGMCTYHVKQDQVVFKDWPACPTYCKTTLTKVLEGNWKPQPKMKVKCTIDAELSYQDAQDLRETMIEAHDLRDFILEEDRAAKQGLLEGDNFKVEESLMEATTLDELVIAQLNEAKKDKGVKVDLNALIEIYKALPVEPDAEDDT